MYRNLFYLLAILLLLAAAYLMLRADQRLAAPAPAETDVLNGGQAEPEARTFAWRFATVEAEGDLPPRTDVALITGGDTYNLGSYPGTCAEIAPETLLPGEVAGVLCWWAGSGDEIGVFRAGDAYVVRRGFQEEPTAESEGYRGGFSDLAAIE